MLILSSKRCYDCKETKSVNLFNKNKWAKDGICNQCKECKRIHRQKSSVKILNNESQRKWRQLTPDKQKAYRLKFRSTEAGMRSVQNSLLKSNYGITIDQYNEMFNSQQGKCAICGTHQSNLSKRLSVDHDHQTGEIRELLCNFCNTSLGNFKEDIDLIKKAISYLEKHKKESTLCPKW